MESSKIGGSNISKTSCFFSCCKRPVAKHTHTHKFLSCPVLFLFFFFFYSPPPPRNSSASPWLRPKSYVFICLFWVPHHFTEHRIWSLSPREALMSSPVAPFPSPAGSAESPHQDKPHHNYHYFFFFLLSHYCLWLPRTWPHLNHYLRSCTISPNCHNHRGRLCTCFLLVWL